MANTEFMALYRAVFVAYQLVAELHRYSNRRTTDRPANHYNALVNTCISTTGPAIKFENIYFSMSNGRIVLTFPLDAPPVSMHLMHTWLSIRVCG